MKTETKENILKEKMLKIAKPYLIDGQADPFIKETCRTLLNRIENEKSEVGKIIIELMDKAYQLALKENQEKEGLTPKDLGMYYKSGYFDCAKETAEKVEKLKECLINDDISIYDYRKEMHTNAELQKAVEEQIDRIMKDIDKIFKEKK